MAEDSPTTITLKEEHSSVGLSPARVYLYEIYESISSTRCFRLLTRRRRRRRHGLDGGQLQQAGGTVHKVIVMSCPEPGTLDPHNGRRSTA